MSGKLENAAKRRPGEKEKKWTDCVVESCKVLDITGCCSIAATDPGAWYNIVCEGGCRCIAAWMRDEKITFKNSQRKSAVEEGDTFELAPGETVGSLRRFRAALTGPAHEPSKRRRLHRQRSPDIMLFVVNAR